MVVLQHLSPWMKYIVYKLSKLRAQLVFSVKVLPGIMSLCPESHWGGGKGEESLTGFH